MKKKLITKSVAIKIAPEVPQKVEIKKESIARVDIEVIKKDPLVIDGSEVVGIVEETFTATHYKLANGTTCWKEKN